MRVPAAPRRADSGAIGIGQVGRMAIFGPRLGSIGTHEAIRDFGSVLSAARGVAALRSSAAHVRSGRTDSAQWVSLAIRCDENLCLDLGDRIGHLWIKAGVRGRGNAVDSGIRVSCLRAG